MYSIENLKIMDGPKLIFPFFIDSFKQIFRWHRTKILKNLWIARIFKFMDSPKTISHKIMNGPLKGAQMEPKEP